MDIKSTMQKITDPYAQQVHKNKQEEAQVAKNAVQGKVAGDRVSVSPEAKLHTEAYSAAMGSAEIRQEKVDQLKEQIAKGEYQPDAKKTAEKMLLSELEIAGTLR